MSAYKMWCHIYITWQLTQLKGKEKHKDSPSQMHESPISTLAYTNSLNERASRVKHNKKFYTDSNSKGVIKKQNCSLEQKTFVVKAQ